MFSKRARTPHTRAAHTLVLFQEENNTRIPCPREMATMLLRAGALPDYGPRGSSPLQAAVQRGFTDMALLLLLNGAEPRCSTGEDKLLRTFRQQIRCEPGHDMDEYPNWLMSAVQEVDGAWELWGAPVGTHVRELLEMLPRVRRLHESDRKADEFFDKLSRKGAVLLAQAHRAHHRLVLLCKVNGTHPPHVSSVLQARAVTQETIMLKTIF